MSAAGGIAAASMDHRVLELRPDGVALPCHRRTAGRGAEKPDSSLISAMFFVGFLAILLLGEIMA